MPFSGLHQPQHQRALHPQPVEQILGRFRISLTHRSMMNENRIDILIIGSIHIIVRIADYGIVYIFHFLVLTCIPVYTCQNLLRGSQYFFTAHCRRVHIHIIRSGKLNGSEPVPSGIFRVGISFHVKQLRVVAQNTLKDSVHIGLVQSCVKSLCVQLLLFPITPQNPFHVMIPKLFRFA